MAKELVAASLTAAFVVAVGTATMAPADAYAAGKSKKQASVCDTIRDKKKTECLKAEAVAQYNSQSPCKKLTDKKKKAACQKAEAKEKSKAAKKK